MANGLETRRLGRYELLFTLGQGGMGEVHLAKLSGAAGFEKLCIVKRILPQMQADPQFVERFHHEARVLVQLTHSNIAQVYDMGEADGSLYMAIEYVAGIDLSRLFGRAQGESRIPLAFSLYVGRLLAEALGYAHRKAGPDGAPLGIVHRDISPQNVMVSYEGEVKVIDFGLAKSAARSQQTLPSTVMGKLGYMSPEQALAKPVDHRSDIFSAGIVVWELIAGRRLYGQGTMGELVAMMANPVIPPLRSLRPEVSPALEQALLRALAADPVSRYQRAEDFARSLNELAVREHASIDAEQVGNLVKSVCPDEFAAERKLQSQLSQLRRRGSSPSISSAPTRPEATPPPQEGDGTFVRSSEGLTAAQRALSVVAEMKDPTSGAASTSASQPAVQVPRSRLPVVVVGVLAVVGVGAGLYFALYEPTPELPAASEPVVPDAAVVSVETPAPTVEPKAVDSGAPLVELEVDAGPVEQERALVSVSGTLFRVTHADGRHYILLQKGQRLSAGDRLKLVGKPEGDKRELFGSAAVLSLTGTLATLILDEDVPPAEALFAVRDASPAPRRDRGASRAGKPADRSTDAGGGQGVAERPAVSAGSPEDWEKPADPGPGTLPKATAEPSTTPPPGPPPAMPEPSRGVELSGRLEVIDPLIGGKYAQFYNSNRFILSACEVRLPNGRTRRFATREQVARNETWSSSLSTFYPDRRPPDPRAQPAYAVINCREGSGLLKIVGTLD